MVVIGALRIDSLSNSRTFNTEVHMLQIKIKRQYQSLVIDLKSFISNYCHLYMFI